MTRYDAERVLRFVNAVVNGRDPDQGDTKAAAEALGDVLTGADIRGELGALRKRGKRGKIFDTSQVYIDDPLFGIVLRHVAGDTDDKQVRAEFESELKERHRIVVGDKTIKRYIEEIRPRAENANNLRAYLDALADRGKMDKK